MDVYIFVSLAHPHVRAFTANCTGGNLPAVSGPWSAIKGRALYLASALDPIAIAVREKGFFLVGIGGRPSADGEELAAQLRVVSATAA
jgi:hypothetical protein